MNAHPAVSKDTSRRNYVGPSVSRLSSALPEGASAIIEREPKSVTQSAPAHRRGWRLRFDRRLPYGVDALTGWTTGADPLAHLSLRFPNLASAIRYAERHDLAYEIRDETAEKKPPIDRPGLRRQCPDQLCCWPTGPHALCCGNYPFSSGGGHAQSSS